MNKKNNIDVKFILKSELCFIFNINLKLFPKLEKKTILK